MVVKRTRRAKKSGFTPRQPLETKDTCLISKPFLKCPVCTKLLINLNNNEHLFSCRTCNLEWFIQDIQELPKNKTQNTNGKAMRVWNLE